MKATIPESLLSKLKDVIPESSTLIDESQFDSFTKDGKFDEVLFRKYLVDRKRAFVYRRVSDKARAITTGFSDREGGSIMDTAQEFGQFILNDLSELLDAESKISKAFEEYCVERTSDKKRGLEAALDMSVNNLKGELRDAVNVSATYLDAVCDETIGKMHLLGDSKLSKARSFLSSQMNKFKEVNKMVAEEAQKLLEEDVWTAIKDKIDGLEDSKDVAGLDSLKFSVEESERIFNKLKNVVSKEIDNQIKLREETVYGLLSRTTDIKSPEGLYSFINSSGYIKDEFKELIKDVIGSGFFAPNPAEYRKWFTATERELYNQVSERRLMLEEIYKSDLWKFCNGGFWAPLSHLITIGFCTGATARVAYEEALEGNYSLLINMIAVVACVAAVAFIPNIMVMAGAKITTAAATKGFLIGVAKEGVHCALKDAISKTDGRRNLSAADHVNCWVDAVLDPIEIK